MIAVFPGLFICTVSQNTLILIRIKGIVRANLSPSPYFYKSNFRKNRNTIFLSII